MRLGFGGFRNSQRVPDEMPVDAVDSRWSAVSSVVDLAPPPGRELVQLLLDASSCALDIDLAGVAARGTRQQATWTALWPGEHYRLLAGLVEVLQPQCVVEIGTFHGTGSLALLERLPASGRVCTFDVQAWNETPECMLTEADFASGRLTQHLSDLSNPAEFARHRELLHAADMVFLDAPKDGRFEPAFLELAVPLWSGSRRLLVLDDVRLLPMLQLWRDLPYPKLDATSLGHWSGTGLAFTR